MKKAKKFWKMGQFGMGSIDVIVVEEDLGGYISNGVFIAAAIYCGFKYKLFKESLNVIFNISQRSINTKLKSLKIVA